MEDNYKIYKYTNQVNGKIYIGQTKNTLEERAKSNGSNYCESRYFWNAIQKYGWKNFIGEIIEENLTREEANEREIFYIKKYDSTNRDVGYNLEYGGNNSLMPDESKKIISEKAKERYIDKTKNPMYGKKHSQETLDKMRSKKIGKNNPMYGRHLSEESKRKQKETFERNGSTRTHVWTDEERKQRSEISKRYCEQNVNKKVRCLEDDLVFGSITEAAKYYGVSVSTLSGTLHGKQHTSKGKHFEFVS